MPTENTVIDPSAQPLSLRITNPDREMRQMWDTDMQEEHLAIACRARELFESRGCENGRDWEDWLRAESELYLKE